MSFWRSTPWHVYLAANVAAVATAWFVYAFSADATVMMAYYAGQLGLAWVVTHMAWARIQEDQGVMVDA